MEFGGYTFSDPNPWRDDFFMRERMRFASQSPLAQAKVVPIPEERDPVVKRTADLMLKGFEVVFDTSLSRKGTAYVMGNQIIVHPDDWTRIREQILWPDGVPFYTRTMLGVREGERDRRKRSKAQKGKT